MDKLFNVSSGPHIRSGLTTSNVMFDVLLALLPVTAIGIWRNGIPAVIVVAAAIISAVVSEAVLNLILKKKSTVGDFSAAITGLLLALCIPASVPLYIPIIGSVFAIVIVKGLFGGLGKNFMNPALTARCFLLISFSGAMTTYQVDAVSVATPLADIASGASVNLGAILLGNSYSIIGNSALGLIIGGLFLWCVGGITWQIPVSVIVSFGAFIALFGGHGFDLMYLAGQIAAGGILMAAFFMATDPVTSPVTGKGQLLFGCCVGLISGLFRVFGSAADSVSYAVIISNMFVPFIDSLIVSKPYGHRHDKKGEKA